MKRSSSRSPQFAACIVAALCAFSASTIRATTLAKLDLPALARAAGIVVDARFVDAQARQDRGSIWTFAQFQVLDTLEGVPSGQRITVRLPGGQIGHLRESVDGVPRFAPGERVVLFLERTSAGDFGITGWTQGTFRVDESAGPGSEILTQDTSAIPIFDPHAREFRSSGISRMSMSEFRERLAAARAAIAPARRQP